MEPILAPFAHKVPKVIPEVISPCIYDTKEYVRENKRKKETIELGILHCQMTDAATEVSTVLVIVSAVQFTPDTGALRHHMVHYAWRINDSSGYTRGPCGLHFIHKAIHLAVHLQRASQFRIHGITVFILVQILYCIVENHHHTYTTVRHKYMSTHTTLFSKAPMYATHSSNIILTALPQSCIH